MTVLEASVLEQLRAEEAIKKTLYDKCLNCGLDGVGDNDPWRHTFRFEMDECICKQCGADFYQYSERYLKSRLAGAK